MTDSGPRTEGLQLGAQRPRGRPSPIVSGSPQAPPGLLWFPTGASGLFSQGPPRAALMAQPGAPGTSPPPRPLCQPPGPLTAETQSSAAALAQQSSRPPCATPAAPYLLSAAQPPAQHRARRSHSLFPDKAPWTLWATTSNPARPVPPHLLGLLPLLHFLSLPCTCTDPLGRALSSL